MSYVSYFSICVYVVFDYIQMLKRRISPFAPVWLWRYGFHNLSGEKSLLFCTLGCFNCKQCFGGILFKWCNLWEKLCGGDEFAIAKVHRKYRKMLNKYCLCVLCHAYIYVCVCVCACVCALHRSVWPDVMTSRYMQSTCWLGFRHSKSPFWFLGKGWPVNRTGHLSSAQLT